MSATRSPRPTSLRLRILATTDLHANLCPYDYYSDGPRAGIGLVQLANEIETARAEVHGTLLFDNGDFLQGTPIGDMAAAQKAEPEDATHPVLQVMHSLTYNGGTVGNHEFNYGLPFLEKTVARANHPIVLANVVRAGGTADDTVFPPFAVFPHDLTDDTGATQTLNIGIIGFTPPQIMNWDNRFLRGKVEARDIVETARHFVPHMKAAGADLIIALCHSGIGPEAHRPMMENAAVPLAAIDGIDVILAGHTHQKFPDDTREASAAIDPINGSLHGKPAVMASFWGQTLGQIDLWLEWGNSAWRIARHHTTLRPTCADGPIPEKVRAAADEGHRATLDYIRAPVGRTLRPLHSYFSQLGMDHGLQVVADAQRDFMAGRLRDAGLDHLPLLSSVSPFKAGGHAGPLHYTDIPEGPVAIKNVADLYLYPNSICAVALTGAEIRDWLERAAGQFAQIRPDEGEQILLNPRFACYNFDVLDGLEYAFDLSQASRFDAVDGDLVDPAARRVVRMNYRGKPAADTDRFIVITNSYRAGGGGRFPHMSPDRIVHEAPQTNRDVVLDYIRRAAPLNPTPTKTWDFVPMGGVDVVFETGVGSTAYPEDAASAGLTPIGETDRGFMRYRLSL